jgi:hypothetical protein
MTVTAENIRDDVVANLGNRADLVEARVYRMLHYSQLALARLTKWRDLIFTNAFTHTGWAGSSITADQTILITTVTGLSAATMLRSVISFYLADYPEQTHNRLTRVSTFPEWDKFRVPRVGPGAARNVPTHYFMPSRTSVELYPVPNKVYDYEFRGIKYPAEVTAATKTSALTIANCDDLVMARTTFILASGLNMPDTAKMWKDEYNSMLLDFYRADKDLGDIDMAAFRQESNLDGRSLWWNDPFVDHGPDAFLSEQV